MALKPGHRGVIVVHGIGRQRKGETLAEAAEALALTVEEAAPEGYALERSMDISGPAATATIRITDPDGNVARWTLREALWAGAFTPPPARAVFLWMARALPRQGRYLLRLLRQQQEEVTDPGRSLPTGPELVSELFSSWSARLQVVLLALLLIVISPFLVLTGLAFVYLQQVPLHLLHPLDPLLSRVLGDVYRYTTHGMWAASARGVVERAIIEFLEDEDDPVEDLTIVSHSMGCVVAYDALRGNGAVAEAIRRADKAGRRRKITLVTIGSGINQVFAVARRSDTYGKAHFCQPLDPVVTGTETSDPRGASLFEWVDIYARMDLVPAGGLASEIRERSGASDSQYREVRVSNEDLPFKDHLTYYRNHTTVVPRIIQAINSGEEFGTRPAGSERNGLEVEEVHTEEEKIPGRRGIVRRLIRSIVPVALFGAAFALWAGASSPESGLIDSLGEGPWLLELILLLAGLWLARLLTAGLLVVTTIGVVGGWIWVSNELLDGPWVWVAAAGPWAVELAFVYATLLWAFYLRRRHGHWPGQAHELE